MHLVSLSSPNVRRARRGALLALALLVMLSSVLSLSGGSVAAQKQSGDTPQGVDAVSAPLPWPRYGIDVIYNTNAPALATAVAAGARVIRVYVNWADVEPANSTPGSYSWGVTDARLGAVAAAGLETMVIVSNCPAWACDHLEGPINKVPMAEFGEFARALAARYKGAPFNVHRWEFWNEPDSTRGASGPSGWGNHGAQYAAMLAAAVPQMREVDPQLTIASGGLAYDWFTTDTPTGPFNQNFLRDVLQAGGGQYMDYLSFHYYAANIHWPNIIAKTNELRALAASYGFHKPIVCSELGLTSSSNPAFGTPMWGPNSPETQARFLVQSFAHAAAAGMPGIVWFNIQDYAGGGAFDAFAESGLMRIDGTRKPSFNAYRTVVQELGESPFLRSRMAGEFGGDQVEAYLFAGARNPVWVMWTNNAAGTDVEMPHSWLVRVVDMLGQEQAVTPAGANARIRLTRNPLFVEVNKFQRFVDVPFDFFTYESIEWLASRGIISGYSDGTFRPFNNTTRGQLTKIVTLGEGWPLVNPATPTFLDVQPSNPFYREIETAVQRGVISGYDVPGGREFRWGNNVTRGQLAKIIVGAEGWPLANPATPTFLDVQPSNPFYREIETAVQRGIISGYDVPGGREFRWFNNATRAQIAKIAHLAFVQP